MNCLVGNLGITKSPLELVEDEHSNRVYVQRHVRDLEAYLRMRYPRESMEPHLYDLLRGDPRVARTVIENFVVPEPVKFDRVVRHFEASTSFLCLTIGHKGERKTMTNTDLLFVLWERQKARARAAARGFLRSWEVPRIYNIGDPDDAPDWMMSVPVYSMVPKGAYVRWDELGADMSNRTSLEGTQRMLGGQLATMRHNKQKVFGIVQNLSLTDGNFLKMMDDFLIKPIGLAQVATERPAIRHMLKSWSEILPRDPWETLLISKKTSPIKFTRPVPRWWTQAMSHAQGKITSKENAVERAVRLRRVFSWAKVARKMEERGWRRSPDTWQDWVLSANRGIDPGAEAEEHLKAVQDEAEQAERAVKAEKKARKA